MCAVDFKPVGSSTDPGQNAILASPSVSKRSDEPHSAQKPRRTFSEEANHFSPRSSVSTKSARSTAAYAPRCPCHFRHIEQWQYETLVDLPRSSYFTAPHRHPPALMSLLLAEF